MHKIHLTCPTLVDENIIDSDVKCDTPEDIVIGWHLEVKKLFAFYMEGERDLVSLMKVYIMKLAEQAIHFEGKEKLQALTERHINIFYMLYQDLDPHTYTYLDEMEDILTFYVNLSMRVLLEMKRKVKITKQMVDRVTQNIITRLSFYFLRGEYHIFHVLIRQTLLIDGMVKNVTDISSSNICKQVLKNLYTHFLVSMPLQDLSDEAFCRAFIIFENWKNFECHKEDNRIDECLKNLFNRTSVTDNPLIQKICSQYATTETGTNIFGCNPDFIKAYFDHMKSQQIGFNETSKVKDESINSENLDLENNGGDDNGKDYERLCDKILSDTIGKSKEAEPISDVTIIVSSYDEELLPISIESSHDDGDDIGKEYGELCNQLLSDTGEKTRKYLCRHEFNKGDDDYFGKEYEHLCNQSLNDTVENTRKHVCRHEFNKVRMKCSKNETHLPLKKRKSVHSYNIQINHPAAPMTSIAENFISRENKISNEVVISYPATPMLSIAEYLGSSTGFQQNLTFCANLLSSMR